MPFTVEYFCKKFKIGKSRFYRLAEMLWQVGMLDIDKDRSGNGWRNIYVVHDWPGYDGPLKKIREGSFKYNKKELDKIEGNSDLGQPNAENSGLTQHKSSDSGIPATGIPPAECNKIQHKENTNVVVEGQLTNKGETDKPDLDDKFPSAWEFEHSSDVPNNITELQQMVKKACGTQIPAEMLEKLVNEYGGEKMKEKIKMLGSVQTRNAPGFLFTALHDDYILRPGQPQKQKRASPVGQTGLRKIKTRGPDDPEGVRKKDMIRSLYRS